MSWFGSVLNVFPKGSYVGGLVSNVVMLRGDGTFKRCGLVGSCEVIGSSDLRRG
jgi:hypothetical protein